MVSEAAVVILYGSWATGLNPCFSGGWSRRPYQHQQNHRRGVCLNPCFSGGWSRSIYYPLEETPENVVLILVLVEDGLGEQLLELTVSETVVMKFLISLTFGDQKYVPFRVLSRMQIYGFFCELGVRASKNFGYFDGVFGYFVGWRWSWG